MSLGKKIFHQNAATGGGNATQGLVVHLDANDEDSIEAGGANTGAGSGTWFDIANHDLNVPLTDNNDNLEIHIDASNTNSYGGSGSTITDISTNGYSFSTHGNAAFGSDTRGYFTLDGSDDDLRTTNAVTGFSGNVTFEWWFNASESNNFALLHANPLSNDSGINGIFIGNAAGGAGAIEIYRKTTGGTLHSGQSSSTGLSGMASDGWVHFVITITSANVCNFYKDGTKQGTLTLNGNGTNHDTYNFVSIGGYNNASYEFAGKIGCFRMYSEILSNSEIAQNFRAGNLINYSSIITSKHEATQGTLYSTNLTLSLDANGYSSGTWSNTANSSYNATVSGATYTNDGNSDYFDFDGSNDYAEVGAYTGADIGSGGFTLEAWCLCDASSGQDTIASNLGPGDTTGYQLYIDAGTGVKLYIYSDSSNYRQLTATSAITQGTWNHCVFTVASASNGAAIKLYVNGIEKDSDTLNSNYTGADHGLDIGRYPYNNTKYFDGKIAQVRTYSAALTSAQVTTNYNATKALYQNPNLRFNLEAKNYTSGTWTDSQGNHNATINVDGSNAVFDKEVNNFFTLDASGTYGDNIQIATNTLFNMEADCSWEFMFRRDSTTNEQQIAYVGSGITWPNAGSNTRWFLNYATSSGYGFYFYNYDTASLVRSGNINSNNLTNKFEHIIVTWDVSEKKLQFYYDGILTEHTNTVGSGTVGDHSATTEPLYLGRANGYTAQPSFVGAFAVARFYTSTLTAAQVVQNYLATKNDYPNGINGDIQGPTFQGGSTPYHFDFNGSTNYIDIPYTTLGDRDFTLTMYIKFDDLSPERYIFTKYLGSASGSYGMLVQSPASSDKIVWQMYDTGNGTPISITTSTSLTTTPYYHLAFVYVKETSAVIYLNGSSDGTASYGTSNAFAQNTAQIRIGRYQANSTSHDGEIGQIKIFDKALSASEVLAEFNATKATYGIS